MIAATNLIATNLIANSLLRNVSQQCCWWEAWGEVAPRCWGGDGIRVLFHATNEEPLVSAASVFWYGTLFLTNIRFAWRFDFESTRREPGFRAL